MKKLKLFISLWFTMFSGAVFAQAEFEKIAVTQNTLDNSAGRLIVQDATTGELKYILKSVLDNKFNQPTGNATQYLDGAGTPTAFPVLGQADRVITEVRNTTGATVVKGTVVYLSGASGGKATIQKAQANSELTSSGTFGVIQSDINNNSNGYAVVIGTVLGVNTSSYTEGQVLWLSPAVAGGFTSTKPVAPNHAVYVAIVTLAATNGTIEVKVQNGYELGEIHDVLITSKTDNDGLIYEASSGLWKNKQISKAMVGLSNVDNTSDVNKPISTATQNALNLKENTANKNIANGYAGLGSDGKLISSQLPAITITDTFVVGSQAAMLALTAETGDVAVRTDVNKSYILKGANPAVLADWQELLTPTSPVTSVFGRQGAVTANNGDYTTALVTETTNKRYQTDIQQAYNDATSSIQTQLNSKANDNQVVKLTGDQSITGTKTFNSSNAVGIRENNSGSGYGIYSENSSTGTGLYVANNGSGKGIIVANAQGSLNNSFESSYDGVTNFSVNNGEVSANKFKTTNGTANQFVKGDGTLDTNVYPKIQMSNGYIPTYSSTFNTLANSNIWTDGTFTGIGVFSGLNRTLQISGTTQISHKHFQSTGEMLIGQFDSSGNSAVNNTSNGILAFHTNNQRAMVINSVLRVGIGTNSPSARFQVVEPNASGTNTNSAFFSDNVANSIGISNANGVNTVFSQSLASVPLASDLAFATTTNAVNGTPTERMRITSSGNVGIGTTSPGGKFHALESGVGTGLDIPFNFSSTKTSLSGWTFTLNSGTTTGLLMGNRSGVPIIGTLGPSNLSLQPDGGNVGIGTTSPNGIFEVRDTTNRLLVDSNNGVFTIGSTAGGFYVNNVNNVASLFQILNNGNTRVYNLGTGLVYSNGGVLTSTNPSDERLKDDITDLQYGLNEILKLRPVSYLWKNDTINQGKQFGFIAQEVQEIMPELVKEFKTGEGERLGLDKEGIYAALVNAIKEQQAQIKELQKEIEILKNK